MTGGDWFVIGFAAVYVLFLVVMWITGGQQDKGRAKG